MTLDAVAPLEALKAKLEATAGVAMVYVGVPEAPIDQLVATISLAGASLNRPHKAGGTWRRALRYRIEFAYRVAGDEGAAERGVAAALDDFTAKMLADFDLGTPGQSAADIDLSQADAPEYRVVAGLEERVYPVVVTVTQDGPYSAAQ